MNTPRPAALHPSTTGARMFLEMHGVGCAECGRPVTAWADRMMWPCGCPALGGAPPSGDGEPATVLPLPVLPRRAPQHLAVSA